jgi:hypothetical protein
MVPGMEIAFSSSFGVKWLGKSDTSIVLVGPIILVLVGNSLPSRWIETEQQEKGVVVIAPTESVWRIGRADACSVSLLPVRNTAHFVSTAGSLLTDPVVVIKIPN